MFDQRALLVLLVCIVTPVVSTADSEALWPQWRGPGRDGHYSGTAWPDELSDNRFQEVWQVDLGPSYSGIVVGHDRVFVTETVDEKWERVRALRRSDGEQLWQIQWEGAIEVPPFAASRGDWIRATPALDGDQLFVAGMRDVLVCLDANTGTEKWRVDFPKQLGTPLPSFGFVSSPLATEEHIYVQAGAGFVKLDKTSGEIVWRTARDEGGMKYSAFSSPIAATIQGTDQLIVLTRQRLMGVDPETGRVRWKRDIPATRGMNILTPTVYGDSIITSSHGGKTLRLRVSDQAGEDGVELVWENRVQGYMSTPVIIDDYAYMHLRNQRVCCINLETGETCWTSTPFGKYWSMIANGDRILALDERGMLLLIRANPEQLEVLDSRQISDSPTWAHLAVSGSDVYIRSLDQAMAYRWE